MIYTVIYAGRAEQIKHNAPNLAQVKRKYRGETKDLSIFTTNDDLLYEEARLQDGAWIGGRGWHYKILEGYLLPKPYAIATNIMYYKKDGQWRKDLVSKEDLTKIDYERVNLQNPVGTRRYLDGMGRIRRVVNAGETAKSVTTFEFL